MDNTIQTLTLYFNGATGVRHFFRINDFRQEVNVDKINEAFINISQSGAFFDGDGAYYAVPVEAILTTTTTKTVATA